MSDSSGVLNEKLSGSYTVGDLGVYSQRGVVCCPEGAASTDIIQVFSRRVPPGMLKRLLSKVKGDLDGATIYIVRLDKLAQRRMARPWSKCWAGLKAAGVKKVIYTNNYGGWNTECL